MKQLLAVLAVAALSIGSVPMAAAQMKHDDMKAMDHAKAEKSQSHKGTGVVTNVDRAGGKVTLKHEAIQSIKWPAMTMAFNVKDKALLDKVQKDQKVEFEFVQQDKRYVITSIK